MVIPYINRWDAGQPAYDRWMGGNGWEETTINQNKNLENNVAELVAIDVVPQIPKIMRAQNPPWEIAAQLQDKWFASETMTYPDTQIAETNLIKMEWLLGYEKVKKAYDNLIVKIDNEKSINLLSNSILPALLKKEFYQNLPQTIGDYDEFYLAVDEYLVNNKHESVPKFDYYYYNYEVFKSIEINELTGAIGGGSLRVFPNKIKVTKTDETTFLCEILQVGIYLRDSFDFNEVQ